MIFAHSINKKNKITILVTEIDIHIEYYWKGYKATYFKDLQRYIYKHIIFVFYIVSSKSMLTVNLTHKYWHSSFSLYFEENAVTNVRKTAWIIK